MGNIPKNNMKKIIIIPDIHTFSERAEKICQRYEATHDIICMGDYFDQFGDTVEDNINTAKWLKESLSKPNRIHLWGNHDLPYHPQINLNCSGFSIEKKKAINMVLSIDDWNKLKFYTVFNHWYFSHAGLNKFWFLDPRHNNLNIEYIDAVLEDSFEKTKLGYTHNAIWSSDSARGGSSKWGGILWADWSRVEFIENIKQVVSHTPIYRIQQFSDNVINSHIINVDSSAKTPLMEILQIDEDGEPNVIQLPVIL